MTEFLSQFHLLRPWWLLALLPAAALCYCLSRSAGSANQWRKLVSPHLLPFLLEGENGARKSWPVWSLLALWALGSFALAGPTWTRVPQPVEQSTSHLVINWDMSPSMLAEDITPSRLERSRLKLIDLLKARKEGQAALIAYAGEAYTVTPLTDDYQTIINLLPALSPTTLPSVGSNPEMALERAQRLLSDAGSLRGDILFVTDAIDEDAFDEMVRSAQDSPYRVSVWGVGSTEGAPIPLPGGGFAKDATGNIVVPKLNEDAINDFTSRIDGYYVPMVATDSDVETWMSLLDDNQNDTRKSNRVFDQWFEHGQWLSLLLLPFVALLFCRGWVFVLVLALPVSFNAPPAAALDWADLWQTQDQQAQKKLEQGEKSAAAEFTTPERRGAALYQQEQFGEAAKEFAQGADAVDDYNRGTALTQAGEYQAALEAFDQALTKQPDFDLAKQNRAIAEQLAQLQKQQQQQQQKSGQGGEESQNQQQQASSGEGDNQNGSDQDSDSSTDGQSQQQQNAGSDSKGSQGDQSDPSSGDSSSDQAVADQNESAATGENPYSQQQPDEQGEQRSAAETAGDAQDKTRKEQSAAVATAHQAPGQSEQEQMLEQILRKVPDDPSGLLRNKFKYQYLKRKQSLPDLSPYSTNEAEQRW